MGANLTVPIDYARVTNWNFPDVEQTYSEKDTILYALGIGLGANPIDARELRFVYEDGLQSLPTMAVVLGTPGFWLRDPATGVDWRQVLHGEHTLIAHVALPCCARIIGRTRVDAVVDKGQGRSALIYTSRQVFDADSGMLLSTQKSTIVCRADGGFNGPTEPHRERRLLPARPPDIALEVRTLPQGALIYRLSGDRNPLHADPVLAAAAGYDRPILHGLCTYGIAGYALLRSLCGYDPRRLRRLDARFTAPVYPGETLRTEIWREATGTAGFRCLALDRKVVVLDNGYIEFDA